MAVDRQKGGRTVTHRMCGLLAGIRSELVRLTRYGEACVPDPNSVEPESFVKVVNEAGYAKTRVEGLDVNHNPHATFPLDPELIPQATHRRVWKTATSHRCFSRWRPVNSTTLFEIVN